MVTLQNEVYFSWVVHVTCWLWRKLRESICESVLEWAVWKKKTKFSTIVLLHPEKWNMWIWNSPAVDDCFIGHCVQRLPPWQTVIVSVNLTSLPYSNCFCIRNRIEKTYRFPATPLWSAAVIWQFSFARSFDRLYCDCWRQMLLNFNENVSTIVIVYNTVCLYLMTLLIIAKIHIQ